ncbi:MAG: exodeoxyribonuclease VII large subunit, partial [Jannaschia sp.]
LVHRLRPDPLTRRAARDTDRFGALLRRLATVATTRHTASRARLSALDRMRESLGYERTLERGFAVVRAGAQVVTNSAEARAAGRVELRFAKGDRIPATVAPGPKTRAPKKPSKGQGTLF